MDINKFRQQEAYLREKGLKQYVLVVPSAFKKPTGILPAQCWLKELTDGKTHITAICHSKKEVKRFWPKATNVKLMTEKRFLNQLRKANEFL